MAHNPRPTATPGPADLLEAAITLYDTAGPQALERYLAAVSAGVTFPEFQEAYATLAELDAYITARRAGATHAAIFAERPSGVDPATCALAYAAGVTPRELTEIATLAHRVDIHSYVRARRAGATHTQATTAARRGINLYDYYAGHLEHITHKEMLSANSAGLTVFAYTWARSTGATHAEVLSAHADDFPIEEYIDARRAGLEHQAYLAHRAAGATHTQAIEALLPAQL